MKVAALLVSSLMVIGMTTMVGCGAGPAKDATDIANDPAYQPPGQGDLAIGADPEVKEKKKPRARHLLQPNHAEIPSSGPLAKR